MTGVADLRVDPPRYVAAGELGSGVCFNPVVPEDVAHALREARR